MSKKKEEPSVEAPEKEAPEQDVDSNGTVDAAEETAEAGSEDLAALELKLADQNDRYLRLFAEFENYKKRTQRERLQMMETAGKKIMLSLLPVLDDFDRARQAALQDEEQKAQFESGIGLVIKKAYDTLAANGLEPMESTGEDFDADHHEAITEIPNPEMVGKVVDTVEKGYKLNGNIIRYAKVVVGK